jgi:hypothetical protein
LSDDGCYGFAACIQATRNWDVWTIASVRIAGTFSFAMSW